MSPNGRCSRFSASWASDMFSSAPASWVLSGAPRSMKKERRSRRRPRLNFSERPVPLLGPVPVENVPFPAEMAGFLISSRLVPVYPGFSIILSPYKNADARFVFLRPYPEIIIHRLPFGVINLATFAIVFHLALHTTQRRTRHTNHTSLVVSSSSPVPALSISAHILLG